MSDDTAKPDFVIRLERHDDPAEIEAIGVVVAAAFGSPAEAELVTAIRESGNLLPGASLVAERDGRVVGHVMVSYVGLDGPDGHRQVASLSPLAVDPPVQRTGIGSALVYAVVAVAEQLGEPMVVLEGSPHYYCRVGFEYSVPHGIAIHLPDWAPAEAAQLVRLSNYVPSITGVIAYPPYFDAVSDRDHATGASPEASPDEIAVDDPRAADVRALLERHLAYCREHTPPHNVFALDVDGLVDDAVTLFSLRRDGEVLAVGALKQLGEGTAELKSMHTSQAARGRGVGRAMLDHLVQTARDRGVHRLSLETGTMDAFAAARSLYASAGFVACGPFGDYPPSATSAFMTMTLDEASFSGAGERRPTRKTSRR